MTVGLRMLLSLHLHRCMTLSVVGIGPLSVGQAQTPHEAKKNLKTAITARLDGILDEIEI